MAAFEFEATLRSQLRAAAEREQRRGRLARLVVGGRALAPSIGRSALPAAAVAATVAAAIVVAAFFLTSATEQRAVAPPKVVAELTVGDSFGHTIAAYGAVWLNDTSRDELLRIDPDSRRVTGRLPVRGEVALAAGAGALWVLQEGSPRGGGELHGPVLRIDPSTNRVTARIPLRSPDGRLFAGFEVIADREHVWVGGLGGALRIDPRTNRVTEALVLGGDLISASFLLWRADLWALTADRRLLRFDARTGATLSETPVGLSEVAFPLGSAGDALIAALPGGLARIDPDTGRSLWRRQLGQRVSAATTAGGLIWARSSGQVRDRLIALDPDTGRLLTSVELDDFGGTGMAAIDDELWLSTAGGNLVVLQR
jgi:putative pyrroloquinoline-quinone binding quinoprotein